MVSRQMVLTIRKRVKFPLVTYFKHAGDMLWISHPSLSKWCRRQDEHGFKRRLRSSARLLRGGHDSSRFTARGEASLFREIRLETEDLVSTRPSGHRDWDNRNPTTTASGGGPLGAFVEHPSSNIEPRTTLPETAPQQRSATKAVLPCSSAARLRWASPIFCCATVVGLIRRPGHPRCPPGYGS